MCVEKVVLKMCEKCAKQLFEKSVFKNRVLKSVSKKFGLKKCVLKKLSPNKSLDLPNYIKLFV